MNLNITCQACFYVGYTHLNQPETAYSNGNLLSLSNGAGIAAPTVNVVGASTLVWTNWPEAIQGLAGWGY